MHGLFISFFFFCVWATTGLAVIWIVESFFPDTSPSTGIVVALSVAVGVAILVSKYGDSLVDKAVHHHYGMDSWGSRVDDLILDKLGPGRVGWTLVALIITGLLYALYWIFTQ